MGHYFVMNAHFRGIEIHYCVMEIRVAVMFFNYKIIDR